MCKEVTAQLKVCLKFSIISIIVTIIVLLVNIQVLEEQVNILSREKGQLELNEGKMKRELEVSKPRCGQLT